MKLYDELLERGLIDKITSDDLIEKLNQGGLIFYVGFDPTADSLHVGQLAVFNLMQILQKGGHKPIGLMGGATGMIGDPGGKSAERNLQTREGIDLNIQGIKEQMKQFLDFDGDLGATLTNNADWLSNWNYIDFLRDIGKHFSVNVMIARDSVKSRLEREGEGISYTEFSYMLLQAYDFYHLNQNHDCTLQVGGSDQWGNIVSGIDLTRRLKAAGFGCKNPIEKLSSQIDVFENQDPLYGLTMPLITKSDGTKFGKSELGTIWLSAQKTSTYDFYQYFLRQSDTDIIRFLKVLTQVSIEDIRKLEESVEKEPHLRLAHKCLAEAVTERVHGVTSKEQVVRASQMLFGSKIEDLDDELIAQIFKEVPAIEKKQSDLDNGWDLIDALVETEACKSKGQARKLIQAGGAYVNNVQQKEIDYTLTRESLVSPSYLILRTGKKNYRLIHVVA